MSSWQKLMDFFKYFEETYDQQNERDKDSEMKSFL